MSKAFKKIEESECGVLLLITNESKEKDPMSKLFSDKPKIIRPEQDQREIGIGSQILRDLGIRNMKLLSNKPKKNIALEAYGLNLEGYVTF